LHKSFNKFYLQQIVIQDILPDVINCYNW